MCRSCVHIHGRCLLLMHFGVRVFCVFLPLECKLVEIGETVQHSSNGGLTCFICGGVEGPGYCLYYIMELYYLTVNVRFVMKVESTICALPVNQMET